MRITSSKIEDMPEEDEKQDFDDMMSEVQEEIEEHDAEDAVVSRAPELRKLSENIDKATNTWSMLPFNWSLPSVRIIRLRQPLAMLLTLSATRLTPSTRTSTK